MRIRKRGETTPLNTPTESVEYSKITQSNQDQNPNEVGKLSAKRPPVSAKQAQQKNNPLHGVKLADILSFLVEKYGWIEMGNQINIRCFKFEPSIKSSLHFLRRTPWARTKVEEWYLHETKKMRRVRGD